MAKMNARFQEKNDFNVEIMSFHINEIETYKDKFRYKQFVINLRADELMSCRHISPLPGIEAEV
jgi:hypothetical protein